MTAFPPPAFITPAQLVAANAAARFGFLDARDAQSFASGHIPGAFNLPALLAEMIIATDARWLSERGNYRDRLLAAGLDPARPLVIYQQSTTEGFGHSARIWTLVSDLGFSRAQLLLTGLDGWVQSGGAVDRGSAPAPAVIAAQLQDQLPAQTELFASLDMVVSRIAQPGHAFIDLRSEEEWRGDAAGPDGLEMSPRKGRIPGAVWLDWCPIERLFGAGHVVEGGRRLAGEMARSGIPAHMPLVLYCWKGSRAASALAALRQIGYDDVKVYRGSWTQWAADPSLPVETNGADVLARSA